jgi:hypothetical protein
MGVNTGGAILGKDPMADWALQRDHDVGGNGGNNKGSGGNNSGGNGDGESTPLPSYKVDVFGFVQATVNTPINQEVDVGLTGSGNDNSAGTTVDAAAVAAAIAAAAAVTVVYGSQQQGGGSGGGGNNNDGGGGGNPPGSGGGDDGNHGTPPRTEGPHDGYFYDQKHFGKLEGRGTTTEEVAGLPYRALWTADSVDLLRGEPATVYFDNGRTDHANVYNEPRKEVVHTANRTDPGYKGNDYWLNKRTTFGIAMKVTFGSKEHHRTRPVNFNFETPHRRHRVAGLRVKPYII